VKYFSLLQTKIVLWAYTASSQGVGGADSLRWMLDTHMHLVLRIMPLFHACFLVLEIPLLLTNNSINQWQCYFLPLLHSLNTHSTLIWHGRIQNILKFSMANGELSASS